MRASISPLLSPSLSFHSLFGLPLPTPFAICVQLEREPTNPLRPSKIIQRCTLHRLSVVSRFDPAMFRFLS